ncbi:MAG: hypothetical protein FJ088_02310 [Deltaproteobacteria bacterium]|nr:hypothetical protein [Deltaproteobacteria bacterium]
MKTILRLFLATLVLLAVNCGGGGGGNGDEAAGEDVSAQEFEDAGDVLAPETEEAVADTNPDAPYDTAFGEDVVSKECPKKFTTPAGAWNYTCKQICDKIDECSSKKDTECPGICGNLVLYTTVAFGNGVGACFTGTACDSLPDDPNNPGKKVNIGDYCMEKFIKENVVSLPPDKINACNAFDAKLKECSPSGESICLVLAVILRDEAWDGLKGCAGESDCQEFFDCAWEWTCFLPE